MCKTCCQSWIDILTLGNTMIQLYCMNYITTNIRIPEEDYLRLKVEAARKRTSLAAVIRERVQDHKKLASKVKIVKIIRDLDKVAKGNARSLKEFDSIATLREIRSKGKW